MKWRSILHWHGCYVVIDNHCIDINWVEWDYVTSNLSSRNGIVIEWQVKLNINEVKLWILMS